MNTFISNLSRGLMGSLRRWRSGLRISLVALIAISIGGCSTHIQEPSKLLRFIPFLLASLLMFLNWACYLASSIADPPTEGEVKKAAGEQGVDDSGDLGFFYGYDYGYGYFSYTNRYSTSYSPSYNSYSNYTSYNNYNSYYNNYSSYSGYSSYFGYFGYYASYFGYYSFYKTGGGAKKTPEGKSKKKVSFFNGPQEGLYTIFPQKDLGATNAPLFDTPLGEIDSDGPTVLIAKAKQGKDTQATTKPSTIKSGQAKAQAKAKSQADEQNALNVFWGGSGSSSLTDQAKPSDGSAHIIPTAGDITPKSAQNLTQQHLNITKISYGQKVYKRNALGRSMRFRTQFGGKFLLKNLLCIYYNGDGFRLNPRKKNKKLT